MKKCFRIVFLIAVLSSTEKIFSSSGLVSFAKSIGSPSFWQGMGHSFGAPAPEYTYSFQVFNDANIDIHVAQDGMASFMGASFPSAKGLYGKKTLPSLFNATTGPCVKAVYDQSQYYFNLYISENSDAKKSPIYEQAFTQLPLKAHDPNVYYYHVYTGKSYSKGSVVHHSQVEMLGFCNPSGTGDTKGSIDIGSQLSTLTIYNSSGNNAQVTLNYGAMPYTITLEKYSYNTLTVPTKSGDAGTDPAPLFSLRPNTLNFSMYNETSKKYEPFKKIILSSDGFNGYTYTIELFDDGQGMNLCMQGLSAGNYDQIVSTRVRDITPCPSAFWYQSVAQTKAGAGYVDLPGQVWVTYPGLDSMVISKVEVGQAVSWNLIRPLIDQHDQYVYFVYVATLDDAKAKKFVEQLVRESLGKDQVALYDAAMKTPISSMTSSKIVVNIDKKNDTKNSMTSAQKSTALAGTLSVTSGYIEDKEQDICGYIVGMDIFTPKGLGNGNYYYTLAPSVVNVANIVQLLSGCVDSSKVSSSGSADDIQKSLTTTVNDWLKNYLKDSKEIATNVQDYLKKYGNSTIVDAQGALTKFGQSQLNALLQGPVSLKYPPMKLSTVTNRYVYDFGKAKPDKMPDAVTPLSIVAQL